MGRTLCGLRPLAPLAGVLLAACASGGASAGAALSRSDEPSEEAGGARPPDQPAQIGRPAPDFELPDLDGELVRLSDLRGRPVVLEWFSPECPFARWAHEQGPLRTLGAEVGQRGVAWLAINSAAFGKLGSDLEGNRAYAEQNAIPYPILVDADGAAGRRYGAQRTPHLFVIDARGVLVYAGGLDNAPFGKVAGGGPILSYMEEALADLVAGRTPRTATAPVYGCSVKYATR